MFLRKLDRIINISPSMVTAPWSGWQNHKIKNPEGKNKKDQQTRTSNPTIGYEGTMRVILSYISHPRLTQDSWLTDSSDTTVIWSTRALAASSQTHAEGWGGCSALTDGIYMIILTTSRHPWAFTLDSIRSKWILVTICKEGSVSLKARVMD